MTKEHFREPLHAARLWVHECERVLSDRLVNSTDLARFAEFRANAAKKHFDELKQARAGCRVTCKSRAAAKDCHAQARDSNQPNHVGAGQCALSTS